MDNDERSKANLRDKELNKLIASADLVLPSKSLAIDLTGQGRNASER
jgi:hypothetical protein